MAYAKNKQVDSVKVLQNMENRMELKIKTVADAHAIEAFSNSMRRLFYSGPPSSKDDVSFLTAMPKHSDWDAAEMGVHAVLEKHLQE